MLLDKLYGLLNLLQFKCDHFSSLFQAESQFYLISFLNASSEENSTLEFSVPLVYWCRSFKVIINDFY